MNKNKEPQRKFLGDLNPQLDRTSEETLAISRWNRAYHQKMLKAYLKGKEIFTFGFTRNKAGQTVPQHFKVAQQYL
jgi:hypothetical protein